MTSTTAPMDGTDQTPQQLSLRPAIARTPLTAMSLALGLACIFAAVRAFAMLGPVAYRPLFLLHCVFMAMVPWLFLPKDARREIGLKRPLSGRVFPLAVVCGVLSALSCFALGYWLFGVSTDNWFVSIANSFRAQPTVGFSLTQLHLMFTIPACIFSPIGEEIFFRGFFQRCLETRLNPRVSTYAEASWFGGVHLVHHGIVATAIGFSFLPVSGMLWFGLMFTLSCIFAWLRRSSGSIYPAILAHSAFNATMNATIFGYLWSDLPAG